MLYKSILVLAFSFWIHQVQAEEANKPFVEVSNTSYVKVIDLITRHGEVDKSGSRPVLNSCGQQYADIALPALMEYNIGVKNYAPVTASSSSSWVKATIQPTASDQRIPLPTSSNSDFYGEVTDYLFNEAGTSRGEIRLWGMRKGTNSSGQKGIARVFQDLKSNSKYRIHSDCNGLDFSNTNTAYAYYLQVYSDWKTSTQLNSGTVHCYCSGQKPSTCTANHWTLSACN